MSIVLGDESGDEWSSAAEQFVDELSPQGRYGGNWAQSKQGHLFAADQKYRSWAESITLLTATASTTWPETGDPIPPIVHFRHGLADSKGARQKALERALSGCEYVAIRVYGVDSNGYLHRHTAVYADATVSESRFDGWVESHCRNAPLAQEDAHKPGSGAVRIDNEIEVGQAADISSVGAYLMQNIPGCDTTGGHDHGIESAPSHVQRGAVVLNRVGTKPMTVGNRSTS